MTSVNSVCKHCTNLLISAASVNIWSVKYEVYDTLSSLGIVNTWGNAHSK